MIKSDDYIYIYFLVVLLHEETDVLITNSN